jgi:hypothetical protein
MTPNASHTNLADAGNTHRLSDPNVKNGGSSAVAYPDGGNEGGRLNSYIVHHADGHGTDAHDTDARNTELHAFPVKHKPSRATTLEPLTSTAVVGTTAHKGHSKGALDGQSVLNEDDTDTGRSTLLEIKHKGITQNSAAADAFSGTASRLLSAAVFGGGSGGNIKQNSVCPGNETI